MTNHDELCRVTREAHLPGLIKSLEKTRFDWLLWHDIEPPPRFWKVRCFLGRISDVWLVLRGRADIDVR